MSECNSKRLTLGHSKSIDLRWRACVVKLVVKLAEHGDVPSHAALMADTPSPDAPLLACCAVLCHIAAHVIRTCHRALSMIFSSSLSPRDLCYVVRIVAINVDNVTGKTRFRSNVKIQRIIFTLLCVGYYCPGNSHIFNFLLRST